MNTWHIAPIILMVAFATLPAEAQSPQSSQSPQKSKKTSTRNPDYAIIDAAIDRPPDMPGLTLPGKPAKFLGGFFMEKNGSRGARFDVPESVDAVIQYYGQALNSGGWKAEKTDPSQKTVNGLNKSIGVGCSISAYATRGLPGCTVSFTYTPVK